MIARATQRLRSAMDERLEMLTAQTRAAWKWDILSGVLAGLYQGCVWTFVAKVARADLHATTTQMAWLAAAPALGYLFATFWARQMEGRAKLPFVTWTWLIARGGFMLAPLCVTSNRFILLVCLTPLIFSVSMPAYTAIMRDIYPDKHRGRLMSFVRLIASLAAFVSALIAGRLLDHGVPWQAAFAVGGALGALSAWTFSRVPVSAPIETADRLSVREFLGDTVGILWRNKGYRWFTIAVLISGFGNLIAVSIYPIYQVDHFHITNTQVANLQNVYAICTMAGFVFWGGFLDRRGPLTTVLVSVSFNLFVPIIYATTNSFGWLYLASGFFGIAVSGIDLAYLNTTILFAEPGRTAQYQALHSSFYGIRGSIAPHLAMPLLHAVGYRWSFRIAFVVILVGVAVQLLSMADYRKAGYRHT